MIVSWGVHVCMTMRTKFLFVETFDNIFFHGIFAFKENKQLICCDNIKRLKKMFLNYREKFLNGSKIF